MQTANRELVDLENRFWQALVDDDTDTAISMLAEPSILVSSHGAMTFDRDAFRQMAEQAPMVVRSFELSEIQVARPSEDTAVVTYRVKQSVAKRGQSDEVTEDMADSSVWVRKSGNWQCVMHTETALSSH
ncbi:nuclear transport factor 2 family protein [Chitiniphilus purpureus]|uniref:Nuclear transport factor 2 family protein n=1 Tax=Chitiniphilus purpureus TaxID=2981137 RepID=A0ABY6DPH5_9NEIS|nr:nuclear transport factor 2 family protein [Chitiniphilus sp. CD1]UXY13813.1 nuclear transport factor 2 family protein [Chitiniphilus sp. CD1]